MITMRVQLFAQQWRSFLNTSSWKIPADSLKLCPFVTVVNGDLVIHLEGAVEVRCNNILFPHIPKATGAILYQTNMKAKWTILHVWLPKKHKALFFSDALNTEIIKNKARTFNEKTDFCKELYKWCSAFIHLCEAS